LSVTHDPRVVGELCVLRRRWVQCRVLAPWRADRPADRSRLARGLHRQLGSRRRLVACNVSHRRSNVDIVMARLETRVARIADALLADRRSVRPIDVLVGLGWLAEPNVDRW